MARYVAIAGFVLALVVLLDDSALAQVCTAETFRGGKLIVLVRPGKWDEFNTLARNKMYEETVRCCVACMVPAGTKVIITDRDTLSRRVRVLEGSYRDCIGDLSPEFLGNCKD